MPQGLTSNRPEGLPAIRFDRALGLPAINDPAILTACILRDLNDPYKERWRKRNARVTGGTILR
jgi:hypothetical protein